MRRLHSSQVAAVAGGCSTRARKNRTGSTLVMVLVGLLLVGSAAAALVQTATLQRNVVKSESARLQAEWLATSAAQRAAVTLQTKPDYAGEVWDLKPEDIGQSEEAKIEIKVSPDAANEKVRSVAIRVESPPGEQAVVRVTREITVRLK